MADVGPGTEAARRGADEAARALETAGDLAGVRRLRYLLAARGTEPAELLRTAAELLDARLAATAPSRAVVPRTALPPAEELRGRAARAFQAVNTRLAREFETRLVEIRLEAEQQLTVGVGAPDAALAAFHAGMARLAHDLETSLWAEIGSLAAALDTESGSRATSGPLAHLPAPLRRVPVTLSAVAADGPALTLGDAATGVAQATKLVHGLAQLPALAAIDPTGLTLALSVTLTAAAAHRRTGDARRAARTAALRHVAEASDNARNALLEPVFRAAAQAQVYLLEQAVAALATNGRGTAPGQAPATDPVRSGLLRARAHLDRAAQRGT